MAAKNSWTSDAPGCSDSPLPEAFSDGTEVFGGLDGEDDAGDEEEGAPPQAEPEGILNRRYEVSPPRWADGAFPPSPCPQALH